MLTSLAPEDSPIKSPKQMSEKEFKHDVKMAAIYFSREAKKRTGFPEEEALDLAVLDWRDDEWLGLAFDFLALSECSRAAASFVNPLTTRCHRPASTQPPWSWWPSRGRLPANGDWWWPMGR